MAADDELELSFFNSPFVSLLGVLMELLPDTFNLRDLLTLKFSPFGVVDTFRDDLERNPLEGVDLAPLFGVDFVLRTLFNRGVLLELGLMGEGLTFRTGELPLFLAEPPENLEAAELSSPESGVWPFFGVLLFFGVSVVLEAVLDGCGVLEKFGVPRGLGRLALGSSRELPES